MVTLNAVDVDVSSPRVPTPPQTSAAVASVKGVSIKGDNMTTEKTLPWIATLVNNVNVRYCIDY